MIKTHWGPRDAKRLASMVKKTGVSNGDVRRIVNAIAAEKTRGAEGYKIKPWKSILTIEAMRAMAAELAVEMPQARRPRAAPAARGVKSQPARPRARKPRTTKPRTRRRSS